MEKNTYPISRSYLKSSFKYLIVFFFLICSINIFGNGNNKSKKYYIAETFGEICINEKESTVEIYKYKDLINKENVNIANCKIITSNDDFFVISSIQPISSSELVLKTATQFCENPDSVVFTLKVPNIDYRKVFIQLNPSIGSPKTFFLTSDNTIEFKLKKYCFEYDNVFDLSIFPMINPFQNATSWGNCETLSFMDLNIGKYVNLLEPSLSCIEVVLTNFTSEIFQKWVILDEFVLKSGSIIIWRNIHFVESNIE